MSIPTTPPSGFRDFLPEACAARAKAVEAISRVYRSFGFSQISTSAVEDLAVLTGKGGGENEKLIFKILKRGEKLDAARSAGQELADFGLRFDLTLPLARYYSKNAGLLPHPFKAFHIGPVWRAERAQKGRYREFYQCDADIIGSESPLCEVEIITTLLAAFHELGIEGLSVVLNDRAALRALLESAGVPADKQTAACILLDKLDKMEREKVSAELKELLGPGPAAALEKTILSGKNDDAARKASPEAFARLEWMRDTLRASCGAKTEFVISPCLIRGFDYYTGPVFEFRHPALSGSLGGGGRYDRLTEKFGGPNVPACGASIGFERLMLLLEESGQALQTPGPDYCVTVFSDELRSQSLAAAAALRRAGRTVDLYPGTGKLKAQFKYADAKRASFAVVIGPDEAAAGKVKVKALKTGEEKELALDELLDSHSHLWSS